MFGFPNPLASVLIPARPTQIVQAGVTSLTFTQLNGQEDGMYFLVWRIINNSGSTSTFTLRPNGITTNQNSSVTATDGGTTFLTTTTSIAIASISNGVLASGETQMWAQSLVAGIAWDRHFHTNSVYYDGGMFGAKWHGRWNETATNITYLDIVSSVAAGIGAGSMFSLYKMKL